MIKIVLTIVILTISLGIVGCDSEVVVEDSRRPLLTFTPPDDFRPSKITQDENDLYWGLFISHRLSGKDNLWVVRSRDRQTWTNPLLVMNAYFTSFIDFEVRGDSLHFVFYEIDPGYFNDYGLSVGDFVDYKDECELSFALYDLKYDRDNDGIYDNIEKEILTSNRLPDTDLDGKPDRLDFNPISKPAVLTRNHEIYAVILKEILKTAQLDNITISRDADWTKYYGIYYLTEPQPLYLVFSSEQDQFEFTGFPMPLVNVHTKLWYGSRISYRSNSDAVIPHIEFQNIDYINFSKSAKVLINTFMTNEKQNQYEFLVKSENDDWIVKSVTLIESEIEEEISSDTLSEDEE